MKILIITTEIYSNKSATGNIVKQYLDYAYNNNLDYTFSLVGFSSNQLIINTELTTPEAKYCFIQYLNREGIKIMFKNTTLPLLLKLKYLFSNLKMHFEKRMKGFSPSLANILFKRAKKEIHKENYDLVISFAGLIESHLAIKKLSKVSNVFL